MSLFSPVVLFVYNRLWHVRETLTYLQSNQLADQTDLIVYSDGPKNREDEKKISSVREYIRSVKGFKSVKITEHTNNLGLSRSIIAGVTETVNTYGSVIVLEDDMVTSPYFLLYMNDALNYYKNEEKVISIHGYFYPVKTDLPQTFFLKGADCWGWGTWKRGWDLFNPDSKALLNEIRNRKSEKEFDINGTYAYTKMLSDNALGKNDSWAIRWYASAFLENRLTLYPGKSMVENIGTDSTGTHCDSTEKFHVNLCENRICLSEIPVEENPHAKKALEDYFRSIRPSFFHKIINHIKSSHK